MLLLFRLNLEKKAKQKFHDGRKKKFHCSFNRSIAKQNSCDCFQYEHLTSQRISLNLESASYIIIGLCGVFFLLLQTHSWLFDLVGSTDFELRRSFFFIATQLFSISLHSDRLYARKFSLSTLTMIFSQLFRLNFFVQRKKKSLGKKNLKLFHTFYYHSYFLLPMCRGSWSSLNSATAWEELFQTRRSRLREKTQSKSEVQHKDEKVKNEKKMKNSGNTKIPMIFFDVCVESFTAL